jgi:hypothetical protein
MFQIKEKLRKRRIRRKVNETISSLKAFCDKEGLNTVDISELKQYKNSDCLCVLASGKSINDIPEATWEFINKNDSISLNNTILHKHIPTYLFYETDSKQELHLSLNQLKFNNLQARAGTLQSTAIIWHYQDKRYFDLEILRDANLVHNSYFQGSFSLPGETLEEFDQSLNIASETNLISSAEIGLYRRGSLARIIHFGIAMGYQKIIFFGADLNGPDYFFDSYQEQDFPLGCKPPVLQNYVYNSKEGKKKQDSIHMTVDPSVHPVTMINVVDRMNKKWCNPQNVALEIFNPDSALSKVLNIANIPGSSL